MSPCNLHCIYSMSIGIIIGSRISNVLETALRFGCGIAVIGVAVEVVNYVAGSYRTLADADRENINTTINKMSKDKDAAENTGNTKATETAEKDKTPDPCCLYANYTTQIMVQWHVAIISSIVMMAIFIVACELAVGDFTTTLIQSLSVGIGFGLRDSVEDAVYGILAMTQGYGTKYKFMHIVATKDKTNQKKGDILRRASTLKADAADDGAVTATKSAQPTDQDYSGYRIYQAHLTHVVLVPCKTIGDNRTYVVKRWSEFYATMEYQDAPKKN